MRDRHDGDVTFDTEPYMNSRQIEYFQRLLLGRRQELVRAEECAGMPLHEERVRQSDILDQCVVETERFLALADQARRLRLIARIDAALLRIEDGTYGYCQETGEKIGLRRLCVQPMAHLGIEAQEARELGRRTHAGGGRGTAEKRYPSAYACDLP